ncbi:RNA polymerase sigma factor (sigma-70 family) [Catalinimonas alkaloidigena]|uniref:RNA polymerase sigma factor n=1 Tax=Catalinimonas alkaloidigena TaxID=1075417 RepID=UPI002405E240|nr:sigma-70 family RNA polymerase sigma factor [Catalinimonas alkaloidigena]MDF9798884.1 RNA polymerase sigma factor (sigma-70 family) [Catalinimonas alkaloidigena]
MKNEVNLWNAFRKGDRQAFERLYRLHYTAIYHYGYRFTTDTETIRDTVQTLFVDLWRRREHLGDTNQVRPYLYQGMRRLLVKQLNAQREVHTQNMLAVTIQSSHEDDLIASEKTSLQMLKIQDAIQSLSHKQQEVVYLRFYENMDNQSIAERMDIHINTVYNLAYLAMTNLRRLLKKPTDQFFLLMLFFL